MSQNLRAVESYAEVDTGVVLDRKVTSVVDMYDYYLSKKKVITNGIGKVLIIFSNTADRIEYLGDVIKMFVQKESIICIAEYSDEYSKRKKFILTIHNSMLWLCEVRKWNTSNFEETYNFLEQKEFKFDEYWEIEKWNKKKQYLATIFWKFTDEICVYLHIFNKDKKLVSSKLLSVLPAGIGAIKNTLGNIKWYSDTEVAIINSNKKDYWTYKIDVEELKYHFNRAENEDPHGQYDLGIMYLEGRIVLQDKDTAIYWFKKAAAQNFSRAQKKIEQIL